MIYYSYDNGGMRIMLISFNTENSYHICSYRNCFSYHICSYRNCFQSQLTVYRGLTAVQSVTQVQDHQTKGGSNNEKEQRKSMADPRCTGSPEH